MKRKTKAPPPPKDPRAALIAAALDAAREDIWAQASLERLAEDAGLSPDAALALFASPAAIPAALIEDARASSLQKPRPDASLSAKDRIFDAVMDGFDGLKPVRRELGAMLAVYKRRPLSGIPAAVSLAAFAEAALIRAGVDARSLTGRLRVAELTRLISAVLSVFAADDDGLSRTMAQLDQRLRRAEAWARRLGWDETAPG